MDFKFKHIILIVTILLASSLGCACNVDDSKSSYITSVHFSSTMTDEEPEDIKSGPLRMWMQNPQSFNPLKTKDLQWKNMTHLFYDSLYKVDMEQNAISKIVTDHKISEEGLIHTITIKKDLKFHDNTPLESSDIIYSFNSIKDLGEESLYNQYLNNIDYIKQINVNTIEIGLLKSDPFLKQKLIFPIIQEESELEDYKIPIGSGPYEIKSMNEKEIIANLVSNSMDYKIEEIRISILEDTREGMKLFGEDKIDLVLFDDIQYIKYHLRTDVNMLRYPGRTFLFFQLNKSEGLPFADKKKEESFKKIVFSGDITNSISEKLIIPSSFPFIKSSDSFNTFSFNENAKVFSGLKEKIRICYMIGDLTESKIIQNLEDVFKSKGIAYELQPFKEPQYSEVLDKGDYDIALRKAVLDGTSDPSWLYLSQYTPRFSNSPSLSVGNGDGYEKNAQALYKAIHEGTLKDFYKELNALIKDGPFVGIGFKINAVLMSKRVKGDLRSNSFDPYNNIKDVWVWFGS